MSPEHRSQLVHDIARHIDYPSVYIDGPSRKSTARAENILNHLEKAGYLKEDDDYGSASRQCEFQAP